MVSYDQGPVFQAPENQPEGPQPGTSGDASQRRATAVTRPTEAGTDDLKAQLAKVRMQSVKYALSQVKSLAASDAHDDSVLVALDTLVDMAQENDHPDTALFQSLRAQANRLQGRLCIRGLCMEVLGEKGNDKVSSAVNKLLREGKVSKVEKAGKKPEPESTPQMQQTTPQLPQQIPQFPGMPQQFQQPQMGFGYPQHYGYGGQGFNGYGGQGYAPQPYGSFGGNFRGRGRGRQFQKARGPCHFCGMEGHIFKDCEAMKKSRDQVQGQK